MIFNQGQILWLYSQKSFNQKIKCPTSDTLLLPTEWLHQHHELKVFTISCSSIKKHQQGLLCKVSTQTRCFGLDSSVALIKNCNHYHCALLQDSFVSNSLVYYCLNRASFCLWNRVRFCDCVAKNFVPKNIKSLLCHPWYLLLNHFYLWCILWIFIGHGSRECSHKQGLVDQFQTHARQLACDYLLKWTNNVGW